MYITSDYIYTIGMCTLLVYSYMVSNTSTTEGTPLVYVHCCEQNVCTGGLVILTLLQVICTPLVCVQNMSTEVLITYTTTGKIFCSLVNKCMPKLGCISEQPVKGACKENLEIDICLCTQQ